MYGTGKMMANSRFILHDFVLFLFVFLLFTGPISKQLDIRNIERLIVNHNTFMCLSIGFTLKRELRTVFSLSATGGGRQYLLKDCLVE